VVARRVIAAATLIVVLAGWLGSAATPAGAQEPEPCPADLDQVPAADTTVRVVKVSGLLDPVLASYVLDELDHAERNELLAMVIQLDSRASVLATDDYAELVGRLADSTVTIAAWVGPSGATAQGGSAELLGAADLVGVTPGSTIGSTGPTRLPATLPPAFGDATDRLATTTITAEEAVQLGLAIGPLSDVATIGSFLTQIPGYEVLVCTDAEATASSGLRTIPLTRNELTGLPLTSQLFHTVASPEVAYLLFAMGLGLLIFELYTAGIGIAGLVGAGLVILGSYGLAVLPTRWWGIGLLIAAVLAMAVDIQTNVPRFYSALGVGLFVVATFTLYDGLSMSWVTIVAGIVGCALYAYTGMPSMVRTRFSTPTIGRKWMIGEMGEAITDIAPEGTVRVREVAWRAITNRATPVKAGDPVRVIGLDRLLLEIEPEEGGAKDYRERR
jgi:membrane-bound serine protease (ClpP class)